VNGPEAGIVMAGTQAIDLDGRVTSQWLPARRATFKGDDALLALGLDWGARATGTVYGVRESQRLGGLPEIQGLPGDHAHALALAYHFGIAFHPAHVGRQREGHQRTTVFDTPDKAFRWLSFTCQQAAIARTFGGSPDVADRLIDYLAWSTFEALEPSWRAFDRRSVFRLLATALAHSPHPGQAQTRVCRLYPSFFWRRQRPAWLFFKLTQVMKPAALRRYLPSPMRRALRPLKRYSTHLLGETRFALAALPVRFSSKLISLMMRARNEEQFLYASVKSIVDHVDEVVLIDNLSTDRTPEIIAALCNEYPGKVVSFSYPFEIRRAGRETLELASSPNGRASPHLLANYYNWCLRCCTNPFVLKWDADMLATEAFYVSLDAWRRGYWLTMTFAGANVHPNRTHLIADDTRYTGYTREAAFTRTEFWLFPRWLTRFETDTWSQSVKGRLLSSTEASRYRYHLQDAAFLHLKLCKLDPFSNVSPSDLVAAGVSGSDLPLGVPLSSDWRQVLDRWLPDHDHRA
jgi:hypothetical protein